MLTPKDGDVNMLIPLRLSLTRTQDVALRSVVIQAGKKKKETVRAGVQKASVEFAEEEKKGFCTSSALGSWLNIQKKMSCS